jgi:hypothetical protein
VAVRKAALSALVDRSMEGRDFLGESEPAVRERFKPCPKQAVVIRLDEGDYGSLQRIAERNGTKASALIRQAVKEIIRAETGG